MKHKAYKCIALWGREMGSFAGYINNEQYNAWLEDAPLTAVYKGKDRWICLEDVTNEELRNKLVRDLARLAA